MAKVKSKRVGRRSPRRGETWKKKLARVTKTLLAENEEGREARGVIRGVVKEIKDGKDPAEILGELFGAGEGLHFDGDESDRKQKRKKK